MRSDYYYSLTRRVITKVPDGAGGFTETSADSYFLGCVSQLSGSEKLSNQQLNKNIVAKLLTDKTDLNRTDKIVDSDGMIYEISSPVVKNWGYPYYELQALK